MPGIVLGVDLPRVNAVHTTRIAVQYDGRHHRSREQQATDAYRDAWFQQRGWWVIRLTWADQGGPRPGLRAQRSMIVRW